jgi:hypothetical protein
MTNTTKPLLRVVEIPTPATTEEIETMLNQPCEEGYCFLKLLFFPGGRLRAVYKRRTKRVPGEGDEQAREIILQHPDASLRDLERLLKAAGISRGVDWCRKNRSRPK